MMDLEVFRYKRDRFALDGYYRRWPILWRTQQTLETQIKELNRKIKASERVIPHLEDEKTALRWKLQDVTCDLAALKTDAKVRWARLHTVVAKNATGQLFESQRIRV